MVELERQNLKKNKAIYKRVEEELRKNLPNHIQIDHVGSTAIPNMWGKNIIDILIGAKDVAEFNEIKDILINYNYIPSNKSKDEIYQFFSSAEMETKSGDIHIHLVIKNTERYLEFITLKDYLLNNKEEVKNYSNFKKELLKKGISDRKEYKRIKSKYVTDLIERAKQYMLKRS